MFMDRNIVFHYLFHWILSAIAISLTSKILRGFKVKGFGTALWASVFIGLANIVVWPLLILLTLPLNILTLGLFTFVVNGAVLRICAALLNDFEIEGWFPAIVGSILLSVINASLRFFLDFP